MISVAPPQQPMVHDAAPAIRSATQGTETPNGVPENSKKRRRRKNEDSTRKRQRVRERTKDSYRAGDERERLAAAETGDESRSPSALNSAVSAGEDGTPVASGSSTPFVKGTSTMDVNGKAEKAQLTGDRSEESSINSTRKQKQDKETFEEGADFIAFVLSDKEEEEEEPGPSRRIYDRKGKGKEEVEVEVLDERALTDSREGKSRRDQDEDTRTSDRKGKSRARDLSPRRSEREWDRGKRREREDDEKYERRNGSHKRKYDDYDDGYANKKQRLDAGSRKSPWVNGLDLDRCHNVAEMLHKEVDSFVAWISPSAVEDEIRGLIITHISEVVTSAFSDAVVHPFGSFQTKLYLPLGDIDLVVLSDAMAYSDKSTVLHLLANTLKRNGVTSHVTIIAKAKVPIVKFVTTHGRFKVDISINQGNGLVSGKIISGFLKDMLPSASGGESKALRSLVMVTKAFLSQRSMNEVYTGGLGSYSIVCLAVSFLQMHPKIRRGEIDPDKNLGVLVMEFFELYGKYFNYDEAGISLREGGMYFNKRQRGWHAEYKRNMLSIEDPADPSNDISSGSYNFHKVRTAFAGCHGILTSTAFLRAGILNSRRHGRAVHLRAHDDPEDLSILSTVMGITQETINHRKLVQELYDRRILHSIVGVRPLPRIVKSSDEISFRKPDQKERSLSKSKASRAVESVWDTEDVSHDVDYEEYSSRSHRHRPAADEERGRYDIGQQPSKKRRKTGRESDAHTVVFVDDDDDDGNDEDRRADEDEEGAYMSDDERRPSLSRRSSAKSDHRRSYWLSKGIGPPDDQSS